MKSILWRSAITAALGGLLFGFDTAVIAGVTQDLTRVFQLTPELLGVTVASALWGTVLGSVFGGIPGDRWGRRTALKLLGVLYVISALGSGFAWDWPSLLIFRVIGGLAIGGSSVIGPMYIAEIAPAALRGRMASLQQLAIVIGIFATGLINELILTAAGGVSTNTFWLGLAAWQWMFLLMVIPAVVYAVLALRLPESPRFLIGVGKTEKATAVLASIYIDDVVPLVTSITNSLKGDHKPRFSDLRGKRLGLMPIVWIGILLSVFQQFVGINAVFYYSNTIWQAVGFSEGQAFQTSLITTAVNVVFTVVAIALVDRVGRKPLLIVGSIGMIVTLGVLTFVFGTAPVVDGNPVLSDGPDIAAMVAFNLYVAFFAATWGPVVWVLISEIFPNRIRAAALALATAAQWIANFIVSTTFPGLASVSLGLAYGIFTAFAILSLLFVIAKVKETKGMQLEDIGSLETVKA